MMLFYRQGDGARVEAAARLLDKKRPGWFTLIDLDDFSLQSACQCVLGQVYRERRWWRRLLFYIDDGFLRGLIDLEAERHNLQAVFATDLFYREHWITAILTRRAAASMPTSEAQHSPEMLAINAAIKKAEAVR